MFSQPHIGSCKPLKESFYRDCAFYALKNDESPGRHWTLWDTKHYLLNINKESRGIRWTFWGTNNHLLKYPIEIA